MSNWTEVLIKTLVCDEPTTTRRDQRQRKLKLNTKGGPWYNNQPTETEYEWGERKQTDVKNEWGAGKCVRWHPNEWAYTKNTMPCKNKIAALMNGNTHTTINIPQRVCSVAEQKWGGKNCSGWQRAAPNRNGWLFTFVQWWVVAVAIRRCVITAEDIFVVLGWYVAFRHPHPLANQQPPSPRLYLAHTPTTYTQTMGGGRTHQSPHHHRQVFPSWCYFF